MRQPPGKLRAGGGQQKGLRKSDLEAERRCFPRFLFLMRVYNLCMKYMMTTIPPPQFAHLSAHPDRPPPTQFAHLSAHPDRPRRKQRLSTSRWDFRKTLFRREPPSHPQLRLTPEGCQGKLRAGGGQQKKLRKSDLEAERRCFPRFLTHPPGGGRPHGPCAGLLQPRGVTANSN